MSRAGLVQAKRFGIKAQRIGQVFGKIGPVVSARIQVKFMRDVPGHEHIVQDLRSWFESIVIFIPAIKVNLKMV